MSHSNTPPIKNRAPLTARSSSLRCVSAAEYQTAEQYSKTVRAKPRKHLPRSGPSWNIRGTPSRHQVFEKLLWKPSEDASQSSSWNQMSQYKKIIRLHQYSSTNSKWGWLGMHCARPRNYHSLSLTRIKFHPPKVSPLTNPAKVTDQGLCYRNSDPWGWHIWECGNLDW